MSKIQETIDRLKAIDKYATFSRAVVRDNGNPYCLGYHAHNENYKALIDALGVEDCLGYQEKLGSVRDRIVELLEEAQASQLPKSIEWPRTDKGELIVFHKKLEALWDGDKELDRWWPTKIEFDHSGKTVIYADDITKITLARGERVKTEAPDSQERIDDDATMSPHAYCKKVLGWDDYKRRAADFEEKITAMNKDLLRRQRELDARK